MDEIILVEHARYGRMRVGRCVKLDYGHVGCAADVLDIADAACSGRRQCIMPIPDTQLAATKPCPDDLKPYFEITYRCVKGASRLYTGILSLVEIDKMFIVVFDDISNRGDALLNFVNGDLSFLTETQLTVNTGVHDLPGHRMQFRMGK